MLAGENSMRGEEGRRQRETRRRADKGPREAMLGQMMETWGMIRG